MFELSVLILRSSYAPIVKFDEEPYKDLFIFLSWPKDAFCQVAFGSDGKIASYELTVDLYNFIRLNKANTGHPGVFFNAEDEDTYDFVYFRFEKAFDNLMRTIEI